MLTWLLELLKLKKQKFWEVKSLDIMTDLEWESLCDRCGQCCLIKLEDSDTGEILTSDLACKLMDVCTGMCSNYAHRREIVHDCIKITKDNVGDLHWLPKTCAYRLLWYKQPLYNWHPLISGTYDSVVKAKISVRNRVINEDKVDNIQRYINNYVHKRKKFKASYHEIYQA